MDPYIPPATLKSQLFVISLRLVKYFYSRGYQYNYTLEDVTQ